MAGSANALLNGRAHITTGPCRSQYKRLHKGKNKFWRPKRSKNLYGSEPWLAGKAPFWRPSRAPISCPGILRAMAGSRALSESGNRSSHPPPGSGKPTLAIVIPICNESAGLQELFRRLGLVLDGLRNLESQVIYVNDGSTDGSLEIMLAHHRQDPRFAVIDLSRNFGQQAAIAAGLAAADADATVVMDGDLQDPPELIPEMVACWSACAEVVRAQRR